MGGSAVSPRAAALSFVALGLRVRARLEPGAPRKSPVPGNGGGIEAQAVAALGLDEGLSITCTCLKKSPAISKGTTVASRVGRSDGLDGATEPTSTLPASDMLVEQEGQAPRFEVAIIRTAERAINPLRRRW